MTYKPEPIDTSSVKLTDEVRQLIEILAQNAHDIWARERINDGWTYGSQRDDHQKTHPCLIPYGELPESEKQYDREMATQTLKALVASGIWLQKAKKKDSLALPDYRGQQTVEILRQDNNLDLAALLNIWDSCIALKDTLPSEFFELLGERILNKGEPILGYDVLSSGKKIFPNHIRIAQLTALSLARSGASQAAGHMLLTLYDKGIRDSETMGILARTYKDRYLTATNQEDAAYHLSQSFAIYNQGFLIAQQTSDEEGTIYNGINTAAMALLSQKPETAHKIARKIIKICLDKIAHQVDYWELATLGEAYLILGDLKTAHKYYARAGAVGREEIALKNSTRHQVKILLEHQGFDPGYFDNCFNIPCIGVFIGPPTNTYTNGTLEGLPYYKQAQVKEKFKRFIKGNNIGIGYASAQSISDILFLESLDEISCEFNVVLPFKKELFIKEKADVFSGSDWVARLEKVLTQAARVITACEFKNTCDDIALEYANQIQAGMALFRARMIDSRAIPIVLLNKSDKENKNKTSGMANFWSGIGLRPSILEVEGFCMPGRPSDKNLSHDFLKKRSIHNPFATTALPQRIMFILFMDVKGYSLLSEDQLPTFRQFFMGAVHNLIGSIAQKPLTQNTWGDALFAVFDSIAAAGHFAISLQDLITQKDWNAKSLPENLSLRISLHAGPVYEMDNPLIPQERFFGSHVSRAARIEPVTPPGQVYASQQFAAIASTLADLTFSCDYVGHVPLPKKNGVIPLYVVRQNSEEVMSDT